MKKLIEDEEHKKRGRREDDFKRLANRRRLELAEKRLELHPDDIQTVLDGAHALAALTEWDEFRDLDFARIYHLMLKPAFVFDGRAILPTDALKAHGFDAFVIGKGG